MAETIDFHALSRQHLREKLLKMLNDPSYAENANKLSARFRDQKETPLERSIWWIEWVLRNPDCVYLKSPVLRLGYIVGNNIDIIALISIVLLIAVILSIKLIFCIIHVIAGSSKKTTGESKKKNN